MTDYKREQRKREHLDLFLKKDFASTSPDYFEEIKLIHNALPELNFDEINTSVRFLDKTINYPIMINAITGGIGAAYDINRNLALIAEKYNIPLAVGSQSIVIKGSGDTKSFEIVREVHKNGVIIANLSAASTYEQAQKAISLLEADAIQLHLNAAQEMIMPEGDRSFNGLTKNIEQLVKRLSKPVIVKEVGFGISEDVAKRLINIGVEYIDVGGKGGTNFIAIEDSRNNLYNYDDLYDWGIATPDSIKMCRKATENIHLISSGGINKAGQIIKSLCLGADIVGLSGFILKILMNEGLDAADKAVEELFHKMKIIMLLTGSKTIDDLTADKLVG